MLRLRPYKSCDSKHIADWIKNEETFVKWGGERFGSYPINAKLSRGKCGRLEAETGRQSVRPHKSR